MSKGLFVSFEGPDGSGKSSVARAVFAELQRRHDAIHTREPGGSPLAEKIRSLIINEEMDPITETLLFHAARNDHYHKTIVPAVEDGKIVISERFIDSSFVYQGLVKGLTDKVMLLDSAILGSPRPDLTIIIDVSVETTKERMAGREYLDRFESSSDEFLHKVRDGFLDIAKQNPQRCKVVSNEGDLQETISACVNIINMFKKGK